MSEIFISYRRNDADKIRSLIDALERCGIRIFISDDRLRNSVRWQAELQQRVRDCEIVVILLGQDWADRHDCVRVSDAVSSDSFVTYEMEAARQSPLGLLPVASDPSMHDARAELERRAALPAAELLALIDPEKAVDNLADFLAATDVERADGSGDSKSDTDHANTAALPVDEQTYATGLEAARYRYLDFINTEKERQNLQDAWHEITKALRAKLGNDTFSIWFETVHAEEAAANYLTISVPTTFVRTHIVAHHAHDVLHCCRLAYNQIQSIEIVIRDEPKLLIMQEHDAVTSPPEPREARPANFAGPAARHGSSTLAGETLDARHTFENFLVSASNRIAHSGAVLACEAALKSWRGVNPLYIYGAGGAGKTHLLQSTARYAAANSRAGLHILYCTAESFGRELLSATMQRSLPAFRQHYTAADVVLMDDVDLLAGEKISREFEFIANKLMSTGKKMVGCAARAPDAVDALTAPIRAIFAQGLVAEISPPEPELRMRIIEKRVADFQALDAAFHVPPEIMQMIAVDLARSGRHIDGAVTHLFNRWSVERKPLSREGVRTRITKLLRDLEPRPVGVGDILRLVSRHFSVSRTDLVSNQRTRSAVWARRIGMYLARNLRAGTVPEIGRRFGGRDEAAVLRAVRKVETEIGKNPGFREKIEALKRAL